MLQAKEVFCLHDKTANHATFQIDGLNALKNCKGPRDRIYAIYPLPLNNFGGIAWVDIPLSLRIRFMFGLAQGVDTFHARGFALGAIQTSSLFVMSMDPPVAVVGDYRSANDLFEDAELNLNTSGVSNKAETDVESLGKIYIEMLNPKVRQLTEPDWRASWIQCLQELSRSDNLAKVMSNVIKLLASMVRENPTDRPTMGSVVHRLARELRRLSGEGSDDSSDEDQDDNAKALAHNNTASRTRQTSGCSAIESATNRSRSNTLKRSRTTYEHGRNESGSNIPRSISKVDDRPRMQTQADEK